MLPFLEYSVKYIKLYKYIYILLFLATAYLAIQYQAFYCQHWSIVEDLILDKKPLAKRKFISYLKISFVDILYYGLIEK